MGLALLAASAPVDTPQLQRQLDFMVARCRAEDVVRLTAHKGNDVSMDMAHPGQMPTVSQNEALQCVLSKVKARPDLHLGFTGNAATGKADRK